MDSTSGAAHVELLPMDSTSDGNTDVQVPEAAVEEDVIESHPETHSEETVAATEVPESVANESETNRDETGVTLNGEHFPNFASLMDWIGKLQRSLEDGAAVQGAEAFVMYELLTFHPNAQEKLKGGCASIVWDVNKDFPDGTKCFYCKKVDGTSEPFSAKKCTEAVFQGSAMQNRLDKRKRIRAEPNTTFPRRVVRPKPGSLLLLTNLPSITSVDDVKTAFASTAYTIQYVDILPNEPETAESASTGKSCLVQFASAEECADAAVAQNFPAKINGSSKVSREIAHGDLEANYWKRMESTRQTDSEKRQRRDGPERPRRQLKVPGCLLHVTGLPDNITAMELKKDFSAAKQVRFVEMQREPAADGTRHAVVRYHTPDDCAASAHISKVDGHDVTVSVARGDVEDSFWARLETMLQNSRSSGSGFKRHGNGGRGRGGRRRY